jgi:hypothetical protein
MQRWISQPSCTWRPGTGPQPPLVSDAQRPRPGGGCASGGGQRVARTWAIAKAWRVPKCQDYGNLTTLRVTATPAGGRFTDPALGSPVLGQHFLEPVVGERLVVEGRDLDPAGGPIQGKRFGEDRARLDVGDPRAVGQCARLEFLQ